MHPYSFKLNEKIAVGEDKMLLMAGPCVIESEDLCMTVAEYMKSLTEKLGIHYVFKASFDKANRTSVSSFRGPGLEKGIKILEKVKKEFNVPVVTDVHETVQVEPLSEVVDVMQIPAFLCRQTDLLVAAGHSGAVVNIKKGQFMAAEDMQYAVNKVKSTGNEKIILTERGVSFGYHTLVVDYRNLPKMNAYAPVVFDVTHSVQQPGGAGGKSGGQREYAIYLAKAAAAVGVDGFFIETHPDPEKGLSDGPNMVPLHEMDEFLKKVKSHWELERAER